MIKFGSKTVLLVTSILMAVIVISIVSSYVMFREVSNLQFKHEKIEKIAFMRQYEYELMRTANAFSETFPTSLLEGSRKTFDKWFNVLWSRSQTMDKGVVGKDIKKTGFDYKNLQLKMRVINQKIYHNSQFSLDDMLVVRDMFLALTTDLHFYQQKRQYLYRQIEFTKKHKIYNYYYISFILSSLTLLFGFFVCVFLYRSHKKLLGMRSKLERKVEIRTKALKRKNLELVNEVKERTRAEKKLVESQSQIEVAKEKALLRLNFDPLTQLASRSLFTERFNQAILDAKRENKPVALLFLDLDRFKYVNDTLGHSLGDNLLQQTADRISLALRQSDTASRFGGDEFAILLCEVTSSKQIEQVLQRLLDRLSSPYMLENHQTFISASIGVAMYPEDGDSVEVLLRKADNAMYKAKEKGRNTFQFFTNQMEIDANNRMLMEGALHQATIKQEFEVHYQPIIDLISGEVKAAEALIRWPQKNQQYIPPNDFIPLAEELGIVVEIGAWVLERACQEAVKWQAITDKDIQVNVNLSYRQFQNNDMPATVYQILQRSGLAPTLLTLEITEGLLIVEDKFIMQQLQKIKDLGVTLAIDDFGTGYSSLSYLKKFPIDTLKIDGSFIKDISIDKNDEELVKGIISLANALDLKVVAEGVETKQQADFLSDNQCQLMQGYLFSKPLTDIHFINFLEKYGCFKKIA